MTREEAIAYGEDYLKDLISACCHIEEKHKDFVRMAIKALEQESCEELFDDWHEAPSYAMTLEQAREAVHELRKENVKLRKEPCEDAVSREAVKNILLRQKFISYEAYLRCIAEIDNLPSVTPTHKKGKWIKHESNMTCDDIDGFGDECWDGTTYECSICHKEHFHATNFCPNCGVEMEVSND